ncbi:hypothetical protein, partial [Streptococcus mitis]|uniref:hypothetical protein n=1 Tax=Streptococcus mitis TaxID=28037 RepID=UPI001CD9C125
MALQVTTLSVYSAVKNNNRLFKLKTNRLKGRFVFEWVGFSDDLLQYSGLNLNQYGVASPCRTIVNQNKKYIILSLNSTPYP